MNQPIFDTSRSPHAVMSLLSPADVRFTDSFWAPRMRTNAETTLYAQRDQIETTGRLDNFRRASGRKPDLPFQGIFFNDSDVYKWLEGAAWSLKTCPDEKMAEIVRGAVQDIVAAQRPDGYLNTYYACDLADQRWTNLKDMHELYCAGHFLQAAVARVRATGDTDLMDAAVRVADNIAATFNKDNPGACGHQECEMALVEMYRQTGDRKYLDTAVMMISARGRKPPLLGGSPYHQDHLPYNELEENVGHAVRMLYMNCGAADVALETGDPDLKKALDRLWNDFTGRKMYITGGAGARHEGEAFGGPYELPSRAYAETCAAIAVVMWSARMLCMKGDPEYADVMERALYNGVLSGLSLDGTQYFYENPLSDRGNHRRKEWYGCACCPPNLARLLAELPGYAMGVSDDTLWVNLYVRGEARFALKNGTSGTIRIDTDYPWDGKVVVTLELDRPSEFSLKLRIPDWVDAASDSINGEMPVVATAGYIKEHRLWKTGDRIELNLGMTPRTWQAHPRVEGARGRVAVSRGSLVYCLEAVDNPGFDVWDARVDPRAEWTPAFHEEILNGVVTLRAVGSAADSESWGNDLYRPAGPGTRERAVTLTAVPYYAWANREPGPMTVFI